MYMVKLEELAIFSLGKNQSRIDKQTSNLYTPEDFEKDLLSEETDYLSEGCIINLMKTKSAPLTSLTKSKDITSNFLICKLDTSKIYPWYFCYQFNETKNIEQQIARYHQGITTSVKRLNVQNISELEISLPNYEKQKIIGDMYRLTLKQNFYMVKQAESVKQYSMEIIKRVEENYLDKE